MPELPEVETIRRGLEPEIVCHQINQVLIRNRQLRWPIPDHLTSTLPGKHILSVGRRGKYLLIQVEAGLLILHLGMSGSLKLTPISQDWALHEHWGLNLSSGWSLRLHDPRRFGAVLWSQSDDHPLLIGHGPEPLSTQFTGQYLWEQARHKTRSVKSLIMDSHVVAGIGNIYANEALYRAGIHPARAAGNISKRRYDQLASSAKTVLEEAIAAGGTSLQDFLNPNGIPGYFKQSLQVYGRAGEPCSHCAAPIRRFVLAQRATYYCHRCQR